VAEQDASKPVRVRLREHLGSEPGELPVVSRALEAWDRPKPPGGARGVARRQGGRGRRVSVMEGYRAGLAELVPDGGPAV